MKQLDIFTNEPAVRSLVEIFGDVNPSQDGHTLKAALVEARQHNKVDVTWDYDTVGMDEIWEHPMVREHNRACHVLGHYFFTIYKRIPGVDFQPPYKLAVGRIGNSDMFEIHPKQEE